VSLETRASVSASDGGPLRLGSTTAHGAGGNEPARMPARADAAKHVSPAIGTTSRSLPPTERRRAAGVTRHAAQSRPSWRA